MAKVYVVTAGAPQGSLLGPHGMLGLRVPKEATLIDFADDLGMAVVTKHPENVEIYESGTIHAIRASLRRLKLDLTDKKAEAVLITNRKKINTVKIRVGNHKVVPKLIIKYLRISIDPKLSVTGHLNYAREKTAKASSSLARMVPNIGWVEYSLRMLIAGMVKSILL